MRAVVETLKIPFDFTLLCSGKSLGFLSVFVNRKRAQSRVESAPTRDSFRYHRKQSNE